MGGGHRYDDIIHLPHHQSAKHPRMSMEERAAQFSPFAALTGYGAVIEETGRLTEERIEPTEEQKDEIDRRLTELLETGRSAVFTYFEPDGRKAGGKYVKAAGTLTRADPIEGVLVLGDGLKIPLRELLRVEDADEGP